MLFFFIVNQIVKMSIRESRCHWRSDFIVLFRGVLSRVKPPSALAHHNLAPPPSGAAKNGNIPRQNVYTIIKTFIISIIKYSKETSIENLYRRVVVVIIVTREPDEIRRAHRQHNNIKRTTNSNHNSKA